MSDMIKKFLDRAARRRGELIIPTPTAAQAYAHLVKVVAESDRRGLQSPTIEAIRVLTCPQDTPKSS